MSKIIPYVPEEAPFSIEQRAWLNGYFSGLFSVQDVDAGQQPGLISSILPVVILVGTQTGTAEGLARQTAKSAKQRGFAPEVIGMDDYDSNRLPDVERLLIITSTYGEGEMPDNAQAFWDSLTKDGAPRLENTSFSVLALGDASYSDFCQAGKDIDARLESLGAHRLYPRVDCDVDYEAPFSAWCAGVMEVLDPGSGDGAVRAAVPAPDMSTNLT